MFYTLLKTEISVGNAWAFLDLSPCEIPALTLRYIYKQVFIFAAK